MNIKLIKNQSSLKFKYFEKKIVISMLMGLISGMPLLLTITVLQAWLTYSKASIITIGLFLLVGLPYSLKFLWAPIYDRYIVSKLGRRRGWLIINQLLLMFSIIALGYATNPSIDLKIVASLSVIVAFFSASQDIVIDAYRRESLEDNEQALGAAAYTLGYRVGMLISGSLGLILADSMSFQNVYHIMAGLMLVGILTTFYADEPKGTARPMSFVTSVIDPFIEFFNRFTSVNNISPDRLKHLRGRSKITRRNILKNVFVTPIYVLLFILLYKVGDTMAHALSTTFYLEIGFSMTQIGATAKIFGMGATIIGAMIAGLVTFKIGLFRSLVIFGIAQAIATLGFVLLSIIGNNIYLLMGVISAEFLTAGMGTTAYLAFIASMTNRQFSATQFALMSAVMSMPRTFFSAYSGYLVEILDWEIYFIFCSLIAFPALLILMKLRRSLKI